MQLVLRGGLIVAVLAAAVVLGLSLTSSRVPDYPFFAGDDMIVIAHQGGNLLRPDNTMLAFAHAVEIGVDVLEMDIHSTADGELVIIHDDTVDRTTDGMGQVNALTLAQLQALDAAHDWSVDNGATYPYRGQGVQIPTLEAILQAFPDMRMNIEIKQQTPSITRPFCQLLRDYDKTAAVLVASFHEQTMFEFREACPEVATSMVASEIQPFFILNQLFLGSVYRPPAAAFQVPQRSSLPVVGEVQVVTPRFVRNAQRHNINVHVWTVNEREEMERVLATGVDGIITDRPDILLALLGR